MKWYWIKRGSHFEIPDCPALEKALRDLKVRMRRHYKPLDDLSANKEYFEKALNDLAKSIGLDKSTTNTSSGDHGVGSEGKHGFIYQIGSYEEFVKTRTTIIQGLSEKLDDLRLPATEAGAEQGKKWELLKDRMEWGFLFDQAVNDFAGPLTYEIFSEILQTLLDSPEAVSCLSRPYSYPGRSNVPIPSMVTP
jgi:hypothetical protein